VKYAFDTNIFIDAFRDKTAEAALLAFLERALPITFMSAVVMQELAAGARTRDQARELERSVFKPFERRGRVLAPATRAFVKSGRLLAAVAEREGWGAIYENPSLLNDADYQRWRLRPLPAVPGRMATHDTMAGAEHLTHESKAQFGGS
jgi:predicted nucleic acid-binding protein